MRLADSNIWLALTVSKHELHSMAHAWFARLKRPDVVLFCRATQQSFLRLITTASVMALYDTRPLSNRAAWATFDDFLADERIDWAAEPRGLDRHWKKLTSGATPSPKLWMDGYLAAFAIAVGHQFVTADKAFRQFKGLDVVVLTSS